MKSFTKALLLNAILIVAGCSGLQRSEQEKLRRQNAKAEVIYRNHDEIHSAIAIPKKHTREKYPWELAYSGKHPKISKEFFRCKGSSLNPPHIDHKDPARPANYFDCGGFLKHSLPLCGDKEFIYPILIELLNEIQMKTGNKVVITCGHRCPTHNAYADPSPYNNDSKHMIGAEVDFYVQGMESQPLEVVRLILAHYQENPLYQNNPAYVKFERCEQGKLNVSTPPWYNKEIFIKVYTKAEGRDLDNRHPYPYLSIQVRYDPETNERVVSNWEKAFKGYRRF